MTLLSSFLQISEVCSPKQFIWWINGKLGEEIDQSVQSRVVMEIRQKRHLPNGYYDSL